MANEPFQPDAFQTDAFQQQYVQAPPPRSHAHHLQQRGVDATPPGVQPLVTNVPRMAAALGEFPFSPWPQPDGT